MNEDLSKAKRFYRKGMKPANEAVKNFIKDSRFIVHGNQAINAQLPDWLDRETKDWDIFAPNKAKTYAKELESKLDKRYDGDFFEVESAVHPGTYRVKNKITGDVVADITLSRKQIDFKPINGINYATLEYHEGKIAETLADPKSAFRHGKDRETLQRIQIYKGLKAPKIPKVKRVKKPRSHRIHTQIKRGRVVVGRRR